MSSLPRISGRACVAALGKVGYSIRRQRGSHIILRRDHNELDRGTLRAIIRQAGLSVDEFVALL
jgi:predicted RNA binding protein YcfA (HicA-like mRNA interferase family)